MAARSMGVVLDGIGRAGVPGGERPAEVEDHPTGIDGRAGVERVGELDHPDAASAASSPSTPRPSSEYPVAVRLDHREPGGDAQQQDVIVG